MPTASHMTPGSSDLDRGLSLDCSVLPAWQLLIGSLPPTHTHTPEKPSDKHGQAGD
jgi:hypothetical protein